MVNGIVNASANDKAARPALPEALLELIVIFVVLGEVAVGCTVDGENVQLICEAPEHVKERVPSNPAVALIIALNEPDPPGCRLKVDWLNVPL